MRHVVHIAGRELRSLFVSPVAYGVLASFALMSGLFFILNVRFFDDLLARQAMMGQQFGMEQPGLNLNDYVIVPFYGTMSVILLFLTPAITMGLFTSEKTNGTQEMLLTSPITIWDLVLGKFAAAALFMALLVGIVGFFPAMLFLYGNPEVGKTLSGLLGLLLSSWVYAAIGAFGSSLTRSQIVAFLLTLVVLVILLLTGVIAQLGVLGAGSDVLRWLATDDHVQPLLEGLVDTRDLVYFAVMIAVPLILTQSAIESVRWR